MGRLVAEARHAGILCRHAGTHCMTTEVRRKPLSVDAVQAQLVKEYVMVDYVKALAEINQSQKRELSPRRGRLSGCGRRLSARFPSSAMDGSRAGWEPGGDLRKDSDTAVAEPPSPRALR